MSSQRIPTPSHRSNPTSRRLASALRRSIALGLAATSTMISGSAAASGFQGTLGDDVAHIASASSAPAGAVFDGREGTDTLVLEQVAPSQVIAGGALITSFERIRATYASAVESDDLGIGAERFVYRYYADARSQRYFLDVDVLDARGRVLAEIDTTVEQLGTSQELISLRVDGPWGQGGLEAIGGTVTSDSMSEEVLALYEWSTADGGFVQPLPPNDEDPEPILACLLAGPGTLPCVIGVAITIAVFCCEKPDGDAGA